MNVAIIGAGLIGKKRALALPKNVNLTIVCDVDKKKANILAGEFGCKSECDWKKIITNPQIHAIIISTTNKYLSIIGEAAILAGKHILVEKPGARNPKELEKISKAYSKRKVVVMFGFNHRYHPAIAKARNIIDSNTYGKVMFIRARYGHGGRLGYEKEWRFDKKIAGGGELLDQGSHLIDLVNFFCGKMDNIIGITSNFYWRSQLEDSVFFILSNKTGQVAHLSATCCEWSNIFSLEIMLQKAKIQVDGLGRSYGREKLILYKRRPEMGPSDVEEILFDEKDESFEIENNLFFHRIKEKKYSDESIQDALYVLRTIEKLYKRNSFDSNG
ncbi:MAG: Gfo/Idh/MocA family oxidoreductase [Candidatus Parcubacteria bacterium]|nr:Gfo/Idh/MocA family oxidoreductase [Candidatus Parcubacteria bacterium]